MKLSKIEKTKLRTWVEIDRAAIAKNYRTFRGMLRGRTILMGVVKSNAYGHGLVLFARELERLGVTFLGVDSFDEALELRRAGIKTRILIFGYVSPAYFSEAARQDVSVTISGIASLQALSKMKLGRKLKVHIKADTGLGRQGFLARDMKKVIALLKKCKSLQVEGLYSHLATGEDLGGRTYTMLQAGRLEQWHKAFAAAGWRPIKHISATSSTMFYPELHYDMVRIGIGMYGLWPSRETKEAMEKKFTLHPVLSWKTIITETKHLPRGERIGYDLTERLRRDSYLGIVPVGYWHGYPRALSSKGTFDLAGRKIKIVGRVSMDMMTIDLTGTRARPGDEVAIIGGAHGHYAEADAMAQDSDTINYEITTRINPVIKRYYRINPLVRRIIK